MADPRFFNIPSNQTLDFLAKTGECRILNGDGDLSISGVAPLESADSTEISFFSNAKYIDNFISCKAAACIVSERYIDRAPDNMALLISENPYASYARISSLFYPCVTPNSEISASAEIADTAKIGKNCCIGANATISDNVEIGDNCFIAPSAHIGYGVQIGNDCNIGHGATIAYSILGSNVIIHPGARIGQDGFGFATHNGRHIKVPQLGRVIIEDDVEIGANTCIDRGAGPDTVIGAGTKIDNLVQIGHNVQTGKGCIIVAQTGISGSTRLGDYVVLGGQAGVAGHLQIGSLVNVAAKSGVIANVNAKETVGGLPAVPIKQWHRQSIALKKLISRKRKHHD